MARLPQAADQRPSATSPPRHRSALTSTASLLVAAVQAARPRQWPKNLLVFAAPLAGDTLGRDDGLGYAMVAFAAFTAAASAVYLINDVADVDRDRLHPVKKLRPIAAGRLPVSVALVLATAGLAAAALAAFAIREPPLAAVIGCYVASSLLYSFGLKNVPWLELALVASGFLLRAIGGAVATHVSPSGWFLSVCILGALLVASGKRHTELASLGPRAVQHRPVMRWYSASLLRALQRCAAAALLAAYLAWAVSEQTPWLRGWHLASALPLAIALVRFDRLTRRATARPVEDLISRDAVMVGGELAWLSLFVAGLS